LSDSDFTASCSRSRVRSSSRFASIAVAARAWAQRVAETRSGYGMLAMRGIEVGAAVVIIAFGALLLTGYVVTERMVGI